MGETDSKSGGATAMHLYSVWSLNLGRWGRLHVRLHALFILFAICTVYLGWLRQHTSDDTGLIGLGWLSLMVLFVSALLHGIGHYWAVGDEEQEVQLVVGPLGELSDFPAPYDPRSELTLHLAGPLVNLVVILLAASGLMVLQTRELELWGLFHPLAPVGLTQGDGVVVLLKLTLWVNWLLLLVNVSIPAHPFDGGRILRAAIWGLKPEYGRRWAGAMVYRCAQGVVFSLLLCAWFLREQQFHSVVPTWLALVLLAVFVFFSARQEAARDLVSLSMDTDEIEEGESMLLNGADTLASERTQLKRPPAASRHSRFARWLEERRQAKLMKQREREAEEERRVDEILRRVYTHGVAGLSPEERDILLRVSHRIRERREKQVQS